MPGSNLDKNNTLETIPGFVLDEKLGQVKTGKVSGDTKSQTEQVLDYKEVNDIIDYIQENPILVIDFIEKELGREIDEKFKIVMSGQGCLGRDFKDIFLLINEGGKEEEVYLGFDEYIEELKRRVETMKRLKKKPE